MTQTVMTPAVQAALSIGKPRTSKLFINVPKFNPATMQSRLYTPFGLTAPNENEIVAPGTIGFDQDDFEDETPISATSEAQRLLIERRKREREQAKLKHVKALKKQALDQELARRREKRTSRPDFKALAEKELLLLERGERRRQRRLDEKLAKEKKKQSRRYSDKKDEWSSNKCDERYYKGFNRL
jgi:hypothetical protein